MHLSPTSKLGYLSFKPDFDYPIYSLLLPPAFHIGCTSTCLDHQACSEHHNNLQRQAWNQMLVML